MDFTTGQGCQLGSQAQPIRISSSPQKGLYYRQKYTQELPHPSSDDPAGEEAGCGGPGLAWLQVVCGCEAS